MQPPPIKVQMKNAHAHCHTLSINRQYKKECLKYDIICSDNEYQVCLEIPPISLILPECTRMRAVGSQPGIPQQYLLRLEIIPRDDLQYLIISHCLSHQNYQPWREFSSVWYLHCCRQNFKDHLEDYCMMLFLLYVLVGY